MAFNQYNLERVHDQSRGGFDLFVYHHDTDTIADITAPGYFDESKFGFKSPGNNPKMIKVQAADGPYEVQLSGGVASVVGAPPNNFSEAVVWLGIDSLTDGANGHSYNIPLEKLARGSVGWGGRWVAFGSQEIWSETTFTNAGFSLISSLTESDSLWQKSLDGKGVYLASGGSALCVFNPAFNWVEADIYYLQQSGGGSFNVDRPRLQDAVTINTDGSEGIAVTTVRNELLNGSTAGGTTNEVNAIRINASNVSGDVAVFGVVFKSGDGGPIWVNAARSGRRTTTAIAFDSSYQSEWFNSLGVSHAVINAGMNDRTTLTPSEFSAALSELSSRLPSDQIIIRPADPTDLLLDQYDPVYQAIGGDNLIDIKQVFGDYDYFVDAGWNVDGIHPNQYFQYLLAQKVCVKLFNYARYVETPPLIDYAGDDTQDLILGSFESILARLDALETP